MLHHEEQSGLGQHPEDFFWGSVHTGVVRMIQRVLTNGERAKGGGKLLVDEPYVLAEPAGGKGLLSPTGCGLRTGLKQHPCQFRRSR